VSSDTVMQLINSSVLFIVLYVSNVLFSELERSKDYSVDIILFMNTLLTLLPGLRYNQANVSLFLSLF